MIRMLFLVLLAAALLWIVRYSDTKGWIPGDRPRLPYMQQVAGDRAIVAWRTSQRLFADARLEWGFEQDSGAGPLEWNEAPGETATSTQDPRYCDHHVVLTGLPPQRKIHYRAFNDTQLIGQVRGAVDDLLPPIKQIMDWQAPRAPGSLEASEKGLSATAGPFVDDLTRLLGPDALGMTAPLMPVLTEIIGRVQQTFPDSRRNGIQIATLIERLRRSLPDTPDGPVLNVDVVLKSTPGLAAALQLPTGGSEGPR